jgi:hypothetical protein
MALGKNHSAHKLNPGDATSPPPLHQADICQLGMDQRKVNMLAREYCDHAKIKFKPIILSHRACPRARAALDRPPVIEEI